MRTFSAAESLPFRQNLPCTSCPAAPPASRSPAGWAESWIGSPPSTWIRGSWPPTDSWIKRICAVSETFLADGVDKRQTRQSRKFLFSVLLSVRTGNSQQHFSNTHFSSFSRRRGGSISRPNVAPRCASKRANSVSVQLKDIFYWQTIIKYNLKIYRTNERDFLKALTGLHHIHISISDRHDSNEWISLRFFG